MVIYSILMHGNDYRSNGIITLYWRFFGPLGDKTQDIFPPKIKYLYVCLNPHRIQIKKHRFVSVVHDVNTNERTYIFSNKALYMRHIFTDLTLQCDIQYFQADCQLLKRPA